MITKYKTQKWWDAVQPLITAVEVERETSSSVWINGRRNGKDTEYDQYHDTWREARDHLLVKAKSELKAANARLETAMKHCNAVMLLTPKGGK